MRKKLNTNAAIDQIKGRVFVCLTALLAACGVSPEYGAVPVNVPQDLPDANHQISVTTWNVGYGALGAGADFIADGGENMRALDQATISAAATAIGQQTGQFDSQFILLQELADASILTRGVPVRDVVEGNLPDYSQTYWQDLEITNAPTSLRISHGMGVYGRNRIDSINAEELPQEPGYFFLNVKRYYAALVARAPIAGSDKQWVLMNIHLSAFDKDAGVRRAQIAAVFDLAQAEYDKGNYVVIGGDWNMRISTTDFTHTTDDEHLFWIFDFPPEMLPAGWQFGVDPTTPTVRTLHQPYVAGDNYTAIIDGFAYSPNVTLGRISTQNLGFAESDHHPVTGIFRTRR